MLKINEVAKIYNLKESTIRYYDKEGLLPTIKRDDNNYRYFNENDLEVFNVIRCLKNSGMSINKIKEYMIMAKQGDKTIKDRYEFMLKHKEDILKKKKELEESLKLVNYKINLYENYLKKQ